LVAVLATFSALLAAGCTIFPQGAYWPSSGDHVVRVSPEAPTGEIGGGRPRADLVAAAGRRWSDEALADSARRMDGWVGRAVYMDVVQAVVWLYVERVTYRDLVVAGMESLRAAMESPEFRKRFCEARDEERRRRFAEALDILILKSRANNPWFACQAADWLAVAMEKNRALLGVPDGAVVAEFLFGAMDSLDPYTRFLTPEMLRVYEEQIEGRYTGIGAAIEKRGGRIFFMKVFEGGPAEAAGLKPGDELLSVDGEAVAPLSVGQVTRRLRGQAGTSVTLKVLSAGEAEPREVAVVRRVLSVPAVQDVQMVDAERRVGYLRLADFRDGVEKPFRRAVRQLADQGAQALILDLRDNPGGSLFSAIDVAGALLEGGGRVARTRGRALGATWTYDVPWLARPAWRGPLAVLVNGRTASAAEIVASALARHERATVVGTTTFGKGAVQIYLPTEWGESAVSITIARVYDAENECLDGRGVVPDVEASEAEPPPEKPADDPVVRAALESLAAPARKP
jgi:carboxyl-terminal processing protease